MSTDDTDRARRSRSSRAWIRSASTAWRSCMAAGATSWRSAPICGPASAWCAAAPARRWSAIRRRSRRASGNTWRSASIRSSSRATRTWRRPTASPSWCSRCCRSAHGNGAPLSRQHGPFGETIANEYRPLDQQARAVMSAEALACRSSRCRSRCARRTGCCRSRILLGLAGCLAAGLIPARVLPAPTDVLAAGWKLLLTGELSQNIWVSFWRAHRRLRHRRRDRLCARARQRPVARSASADSTRRCR